MILSWLIVCMTIVSNDLQESIMRWFLSPGPGHDSSLVSDHLSSSQLPVWTIYAEKICVPTTSDLDCRASWAFEMVSGENISEISDTLPCYGSITQIATLGQNVSKMLSFLFQLSGLSWLSPHCRSLTPTSPPRTTPAGSSRCLSGTWQSAEQSAGTNKDLFAGEIFFYKT